MQSFAFLMPSKMPSFSCQEDHQSISEFITKPHISMDKKRKKKNCTYLSSVQSKMQERRIKKEDKLKKARVEEESPKEYIHVRARRGQATDSHSLAERVRREKISQRMKVLQALVPGCNKITGKTLMLDEIINYVQSLQNQIEFLSMKLASMSCSLHEFGLDFDGIMNQTQVANRLRSSISEESLTVPSLLPQTNLIKPIIFEGELLKDHLNYNNSSSPMQCQGATSYSHDSDSFLIQVGDQRQGFLNQVVFNNMGSFQ